MEQDLHRHSEFLRAIAHRLLRDVHAADDVVHDAYLEVLERAGPFSRAYLAVAVRHKALKWALVRAEWWVADNVPQPRMSVQLYALGHMFTQHTEGV